MARNDSGNFYRCQRSDVHIESRHAQPHYRTNTAAAIFACIREWFSSVTRDGDRHFRLSYTFREREITNLLAIFCVRFSIVFLFRFLTEKELSSQKVPQSKR